MLKLEDCVIVQFIVKVFPPLYDNYSINEIKLYWLKNPRSVINIYTE